MALLTSFDSSFGLPYFTALSSQLLCQIILQKSGGDDYVKLSKIKLFQYYLSYLLLNCLWCQTRMQNTHQYMLKLTNPNQCTLFLYGSLINIFSGLKNKVNTLVILELCVTVEMLHLRKLLQCCEVWT